MRTTIDIDDDVLAAAKDIARAEGKTMSQVISERARKALTADAAGFAEQAASFDAATWPTFPDRGGPPVTTELIRKIEEELDLEDATAWDHETDAPRVFADDLRVPHPRTKS